jgi:aminoglycoside 3-N-acetyltransferase
VRRFLTKATVARLKRGRNALAAYRDRLFSVGAETLRARLVALGIRAGDVVYVRSSWDDMRSIRATPTEVIAMLGECVGESGTIVMPTYPVTGLSQDYLDAHPMFDWRRTPSRSGLLTEIFRRMPGTARSLHPTHPVAARGARAAWVTDGHEHSDAPFDDRSPFQKLREANARILSIGRFEAMTLRHFADHCIRDRIPYPLYSEGQTLVTLKGPDGRSSTMLTRANNPDLGCDHRAVLARLRTEGLLRTARVGLAPLSIVEIQPYIDAYRRYYDEGLFRHFLRSREPSRSWGSPRTGAPST